MTEKEVPAGGVVSIVESVDAALVRHAIDALLRGGRDAEIAQAKGVPGLCGPTSGDRIH